MPYQIISNCEEEFDRLLALTLERERERLAQQRSASHSQETDSLQQEIRGVQGEGEKA